MVEQIVYFILGFALCGLIGLAFLPLVSARARRLTLMRIESRLPMTFDEIEAERDLLRARFAVEKRALEIDAEQARKERAADSAELGRRAVAVMRAQENLQQTQGFLRERDAQLAKSLEFGEKTKAELLATRESLAARQAELTQKNSDYDALSEAREKLEQRALTLEAELASANSKLLDTRKSLSARQGELAQRHSDYDLLSEVRTKLEQRVLTLEATLASAISERLDTREKWQTAEAARRETSERAEHLAEQVKSLTASLAEAERLNAKFEARRIRLLAKIAAERGRGDELENVNLSMRRIIAEKTAQTEVATALGSSGRAEQGAAFPFSPEKDMLDLREAITRIGRQVAHLDAATD